MFKFAFKKKLVHSDEMSFTRECNNDETINISKFPLLYATPERAKVEPAKTNEMMICRTKSISQIQLNVNDKSPIDTSVTSIKPTDYDFDETFIYQKESNIPSFAYINQISDSLLCSTAVTANSCCSCCSSINAHHEETCTCDKSNEQFHSVNGSFFDFDFARKQLETLDLFYVCFKSFKATNASQISLDYSDLVKVVYTKGEFYLVQNVKTEKRGYVPKAVISKLTQAWMSEKSILV